MNVLKMNALISFMIIITLLLLSCNGFNDQERAPLRCKIAKELKNTLSLGIEKHKKTFGYYPISDGKYFLDSIEQFIQIDSIYIFYDMLDSQQKVVTTIPEGSIRPSLPHGYSYKKFVVIGNGTKYITYESNGKTFKLRYIGDICF